MGRMIQIRHVPDDLHRRLKARAALAGTSLSEYLLRELAALLERPSPEELLARLRRRSPVPLDPSAAELVREERERRGA